MCGQKWEGEVFTHIFYFVLCIMFSSEMTNITDEKSMQRGSMMQLGSQRTIVSE